MTDKEKYLEELAWRTGLDSGGYTWDYPEPGSTLAKLGAVVTDGDLEYFIGADAIPRNTPDECGFLAFIENDGHYPPTEFPETLPFDEDGIYRRRVTGVEYGVDRDCTWCTYDPETEQDREPQSDCPRCEGSGYIDCPGGEWAFYSFERTEEEE